MSGCVKMRAGAMLRTCGAAFALLVSNCCTENSNAAIVLIDLNSGGNGAAGGPGGMWNSYAAPANINGSTVVDSAGTATGITLSRAGTLSENDTNSGTNTFNPAQPGFVNLPTWVAAGGNNAAAGDNFYTSNSGAVVHTFTLTFGGLTPGDVFSLDMLASRNSTDAIGFYDYSLDGGTTFTGFRVLNADGTVAATNGWDTNNTQSQAFALSTQGYALHRYLNASNIPLTGSTLQIRVTDANATAATFASLNAIQLTVIPEPGTYALVLILAAVGLRHRSKYSPPPSPQKGM